MCSPQDEEDCDGASEDDKAQQAKARFLAVWCLFITFAKFQVIVSNRSPDGCFFTEAVLNTYMQIHLWKAVMHQYVIILKIGEK